MTKPLWQRMIDQSDMALGARPARSYSADDALIARAHLLAVTKHICNSGTLRHVLGNRRTEDLLRIFMSEMLAANVTDSDSTADHIPSAS
jgi:hypothetical protein